MDLHGLIMGSNEGKGITLWRPAVNPVGSVQNALWIHSQPVPLQTVKWCMKSNIQTLDRNPFALCFDGPRYIIDAVN